MTRETYRLQGVSEDTYVFCFWPPAWLVGQVLTKSNSDGTQLPELYVKIPTRTLNLNTLHQLKAARNTSLESLKDQGFKTSLDQRYLHEGKLCIDSISLA